MDRYDKPDASNDDNFDASDGSTSIENSWHITINLETLLIISNIDHTIPSFFKTCLRISKSILPVNLSTYMLLLSKLKK
jgi:hypothetical protein